MKRKPAKIANQLAILLFSGMLLCNSFACYLLDTDNADLMELANLMDLMAEEEIEKSQKEKIQKVVMKGHLLQLSDGNKCSHRADLQIITLLHNQENPTPPPEFEIA